MKLFPKLLLYLSMVILTTGCIERFDFNPKETVDLLVVDGGIYQTEGPYKLRLTRTSTFGAPPMPVWSAQATLYDDLGNQEDYYEVEPGIYQVSGFLVKGQPGRTYYIEIMIDGNTYRSQPQTMPSAVQADSAYFKTEVEPVVSDQGTVSETTFIKVYVDTPTKRKGQDVWLRWKYDINYGIMEPNCGPLHHPKTCYITETTNTQNILIFSSEETDASRLSRFLVARDDPHPRYAFSLRHYFNIYQYTTTKEAYTYWNKVRKIANQVGSIFDTPPAPIQGNIYNINNKNETVLGFFEAASIDTIRTYTRRGDLDPLPISDYCGYLPGSQPDDRSACCNCLLLDNSTLERPTYWDE